MGHARWKRVPVLGALPPEEAAEKLRGVGEEQSAQELERLGTVPLSFGQEGRVWKLKGRAWQYTAHTIGYIAPSAPSSEPLPITYAGNITPDRALENSRIKITLDRVRVADYPGGSTHHILFDFAAQSQTEEVEEPVRFSVTCRAQEGSSVAVQGIPIFVGLTVGSEGVAFQCRTTNLKNETNNPLVKILDSGPFKRGLELGSAAQPALGALTAMLNGMSEMLAQRNTNVVVQDFMLGLDFSSLATRAKLAEGSYIAVQIPEEQSSVWRWQDWVLDPQSGVIVSREDPTRRIQYNYLVFSVSRYSD